MGRKLASAWQQDSISGCVFSYIHSYIFSYIHSHIFSYIHPYIFSSKALEIVCIQVEKFSSVSEENCPLLFVWEFLMRHKYVKRQKKRSWEPFRTSEHGNIPANRVKFCQRQRNHLSSPASLLAATKISYVLSVIGIMKSEQKLLSPDVWLSQEQRQIKSF